MMRFPATTLLIVLPVVLAACSGRPRTMQLYPGTTFDAMRKVDAEGIDWIRDNAVYLGAVRPELDEFALARPDNGDVLLVLEDVSVEVTTAFGMIDYIAVSTELGDSHEERYEGLVQIHDRLATSRLACEGLDELQRGLTVDLVGRTRLQACKPEGPYCVVCHFPKGAPAATFELVAGPTTDGTVWWNVRMRSTALAEFLKSKLREGAATDSR